MSNRVELDLTSENNDRYVVLTSALLEYASNMDYQADEIERADVANSREVGGSVSSFRAYAAIAQQLLDEVEQQLDAELSTGKLSTEKTPRLS